MFVLPAVCPITDRVLSGLSHTEQVKRLIEGGATLIQLRDKTASPAEFFEDAANAVRFARPYGVRIIINDRADIAAACGADGVHLGREDLPAEAARRFLGSKAIIGSSTHTIAQALDAVRLPIDYIAVGPIFPTLTKKDHDPVTGLSMISEVRSAVGRMPLVAIGGISAENIVSVIAAGADGAAVIGAVVNNAKEMSSQMAELLRITDLVG